MATQFDPNATSMALRGSASVAGGGHHQPTSHHHRSRTASSSRSRRYNRSHTGGSAYVPQNEFPIFSQSGDVEIVVRVKSGHENRYLLHSHSLASCSGFFEASTSHEWSRARELPATPPTPGEDGRGQLAKAGAGGRGDNSEAHSGRPSMLPGSPKRRWRYELDSGGEEGDIPMLIQKEESSPAAAAGFGTSDSIFGGPAVSRTRQTTPHASHSFFRSVANLSLMPSSHSAGPALPPPTQDEEDLLRDYDNLFRIMYNYPPILDGIRIADAYVQCKSLLALADQYDALAVVGPRVDHHLLQFQGQLWRQIAKYPISYLRLGYTTHSKVIFQEALIHIVGQWPTGERSLRASLPEAVIDLIEDKVDELEEAASRAESRLFRINLATRSGERVSPTNSYLDWLAVSLFRHWLADNLTPPPPRPPPPLPPPSSSTHPAPHDHQPSRRGSRTGAGSSSGSSSRWAAPRAPPPAARPAPPPALPPASPPLAVLGRTYRLLDTGAGGPHLGHEECKRFLKLTPELYGRDNLRRFEKRVDELKEVAREVVRPLTASRLELLESGARSGAGDGIPYLTCTVVRDREMPWGPYG